MNPLVFNVNERNRFAEQAGGCMSAWNVDVRGAALRWMHGGSLGRSLIGGAVCV